MQDQQKYFIVEASALPEIFHKVIEVKRLMTRQEEHTINSATQAVGISRSAFYKYKDVVHPLSDMLNGRIITLQLLLKDEPGGLSRVLNLFAGTGANILTINQNIPNDGCAVVTVTAETSSLNIALEDLVSSLKQCSGVLSCELLAG